MSLQDALRRIENARKVHTSSLDLSNMHLHDLPNSIWDCKSLTHLRISNNHLTELPNRIAELGNLIRLDAENNYINTLPDSIGQISHLEFLNLHNNKLQNITSKIGKLNKLKRLYLTQNQLTQIPSEIGNLSNLTRLYLRGNKIRTIPFEIGNLTNLRLLNLRDNLIHFIPISLCSLSNLLELSFRNNELTSIPSEIGCLFNLQLLALDHNRLSSLPPELGSLTMLKRLYLEQNWLRTLPKEISHLSSLEILELKNNPLESLPVELGFLTNLNELSLSSPSPFPIPPEFSVKDTQSIIQFLSNLTSSCPQWVSKMLVVGEGGVGKTSLLRALRQESFDEQESSTHGIEIVPIDLPHPSEREVTMQLKAWDFGGQEIYHATHQFFLTNRSLFLLVWNARLDHEQGNLYYWLDAIKARAPQSPIFIVATHIDQRDARIPIRELQQAYPRIIGHHAVSCKTGKGIDNLRTAIRGAAAKLPLMGEPWPKYWLQAANVVRDHPNNHLSTAEFFQLLADNGVTDKNADILAIWLHELGDILYYADDETISDTVILKPQWVTEHISRVLTSEHVTERIGILTRNEMNRLWHDLPAALRDHFLRIMEQFDLSYRTLDDIEKSLVVERLPLDPADYEPAWDAKAHESAITMRYELNTIPAGVPTWFIARQHRFTTKTHWRSGVLFADSGNDKHNARHLALVRAYEHSRALELTVRGPASFSFFNLLHDGLELTLDRFPGLDITRLIPCPDPLHEQCDHYFKYENLLKRIERNKLTIECPNCFENIQVTQLIFGIDDKSQNLVLERIDELGNQMEAAHDETRQSINSELIALRELTQRQFLAQFIREQRFAESHTPAVFLLYPIKTAWHKRLTVATTLQLDLCCQAPGAWHTLYRNGEKTGSYTLDIQHGWIGEVAPYLKTLFRVMQFAVPFVGDWMINDVLQLEDGLSRADIEQEWGHHVELMQGYLDTLTNITDDDYDRRLESGFRVPDQRAHGAALRQIRALLDQLDPSQHWGGLRKVLTPEGHYLWLCEHHAKEYLPPALGSK